jgi:hypothetical protein
MIVAPIPYAVGQQRHSSLDSLDYFPTPPWATRALVEWLDGNVFSDLGAATCWEPAAGGRHMSLVLAESFGRVVATDVHDYGGLDGLGSFVGVGPDVIERPTPHRLVDWIITNPPFVLAEAFLERAQRDAHNVALLLRSAWIDGIGRYEATFSRCPPTSMLQFAERVPMVKGRWDPAASTATPYAWFIWSGSRTEKTTRLHWVPPKASERLSRPDDIARFAGERAHA